MLIDSILTEEERLDLDLMEWEGEAMRAGGSTAVPPDSWQDWLKELFPNTFTSEFSQRHVELWDWVETIKKDEVVSPPAFVAVWPRGGGKTTTAETAVCRVGANDARKFVLYVRGTQDKANESISNISSKLESKRVALYYPSLSNRSIGKYGYSKGWTVSTLRTSSGFNVVGLGLDAAVRGVKLEDYRPDLIILDDIDDKMDTAVKIKKKVEIITTSILPAGSDNCAVLVVQNMIHDESIVTSLVEGTAEFLYDRYVSGPYIAVDGLTYEQNKDGTYTITSGTATWNGQNIETCQRQMNLWGVTAFEKEAQHNIETTGGLWDHVVFRHIEYDSLPTFERGAVWVDPAITSTDESDKMGIAAGGCTDGKLYVTYSWEQITSPEDAIKRAILTAVRYKYDTVGVETDQGGDTWISVYNRVCDMLLADDNYPDIDHEYDDMGKIVKRFIFPMFRQAKAGAGHGSKVHRNSQMLVDYEHGKVYHVTGAHVAVEKALRRFPKKPLDLADTVYWLWYHTIGSGGKPWKMPEQPQHKNKWHVDGGKQKKNNSSRWRT